MKKLLSILLALSLILGSSYLYVALAEEDDGEEPTQTEQEQELESETEIPQVEYSQNSISSNKEETKSTDSSKQSDTDNLKSYTRQPDVGGTTGNEFSENPNSATVIITSSNTATTTQGKSGGSSRYKDLFLKIMIVAVLLIIISVGALIYVNRPSFAGKRPKKVEKAMGEGNEVSPVKKRRGSPRRRGKHDRRRK